MVPPPSRKVPRVLRYSGYCVLTRPFMYGAFTLFGRLSQNLSIRICQCNYAVRTPQSKLHGLGSSGFARRYYRNRVFFLFLGVLRCFSSPGSLPYTMDLCMDDWMSPARFPHSEISGSKDICSSPKLFAAYHVFHRLLVPRHPPYALFRLIFLLSLLACND